MSDHEHGLPGPPVRRTGKMLSMAAPAPTVIDPVCGMHVDPTRAAAHWDYRGTRYYFCNPRCRERFEADPEKYLNPATAKSMDEGPPPPVGTLYFCPMDPEVRQDHPGSCPKCGMALEPDLSTVPATRVEYTCPMHPEIVRSEPGACPICGMALEPRTVTAEPVPGVRL